MSLNEANEKLNISSQFVDNNLKLIPYMPEDNDFSSEILDYLNEDLEEILSLPYKNFWSHVVYEPSLRKFLDMYEKKTKIHLCNKFPINIIGT